MKKLNRKITRVLQLFIAGIKSDKVNVTDICNYLSKYNFGTLLFFFSLPVLFPLPAPLPSILAVPLIFVSMQMFIGRSTLWIPLFFQKIFLRKSLLTKVTKITTPAIHRIEAMIRPRLVIFCTPKFQKFAGLMCLIFSCAVLIPLPFTNFLPCVGIAFISIGLIGRDGVMIIIGMVIGTFGLALTVATLIFGSKMLMFLFNLCKALKESFWPF